MVINPVFVNELRQSAFRRRGGLVAAALIVAGVLLAALARLESLRNVVVFTPFILLPLIVPAVASGAFAKEYEQQTWMDLYLTRLTNAQVVWGKFGAYLVQVVISLIAFMPSIVLMLLAEYSRRLSDLHYDVVPLQWQLAAPITTFTYFFRLVLSACLYIMLTMVCSRYSPNRRTALIWSYIAMALYTLFGILVWTMIGALDYQVQSMELSQTGTVLDDSTIELTTSGFMESFHLLFCGIVGFGSFVLMWISLSEQRGYRSSGDQHSVTRAWQPIAQRKGEPTV